MAYEQKRTVTTQRALEQQRRDREARETTEARAAEESRAENRAARERYLSGLEEKRQAKQRDEAAIIDAGLVPEKIRLCRQWLADHPTQTERDFESRAWPGLRANLLEKQRAESFEASKRSMLRSGEYGF